MAELAGETEEQGDGKRVIPFMGNFSSVDGSEIPVPDPLKEEPEKKETGADPEKEIKDPAKTGDPKVETIDYTSFYKKVSDGVGEEIKSDEDIINKIRSGRDLQTKFKEVETKAKSYEDLDPLAKDIDRVRKSGTDLDLYLSARNMTPDTLETRDALYRKFRIENPEYKESLAKTLFEEDFEAKYGVIDQKLNEIEAEDPAIKLKLERAKARLEADEIKSKRFLEDWKAKNVTIAEPDPGLSQEKQEELRQGYLNEAKSFVDNIETLDITVGDGVFKYGLEAYSKDILNDIQNPLETLKRLGVDLIAGKIEADKFGELITKLYAIDGIGKPLADWALEQSNAAHIKTRLDNPEPTKNPAGGDLPEKDHAEKIGEAFQAERDRKRRDRI